MDDLVFKSEKGSAVTNSLLVAEKFGKEHRNVLQSIEKLTAENSAVLTMFYKTTYLNTQNKEQPMYIMNRDGFSLLVMGFTGEKALKFKIAFIEAFNQMEEELNNQLPQTYLEALKALVVSEEEKQKALSVVSEQKEIISEMKPKSDFYDRVTGANEILIDMSEAAKILNMGVGRNKLYDFLRNKKILNKKNIPYQQYINRGWFRVTEDEFTDQNGDSFLNIKVSVLQKGLVCIRLMLEGERNNHDRL